MKKRFSIGLLPRVLIAIVLGILLGLVANEPFVRLFVTFNDLFAQLLGLLVPLIIIGLVTSAIGEIGNQARKLLIVTVVIAYVDTVFSGLLTYSTGLLCFPSIFSFVWYCWHLVFLALSRKIQLSDFWDLYLS